ncbi:MAG: hypothetical protein SVC26_02205 [Pseudomonadota bacterium]|nr:hypothetical protein [Pseudomonadota bacterium]
MSYEQSLDNQNQLNGYLTFATRETGPLFNPNVVDQERDREIKAYSGHLVWERDLVGPNAFQFQVFHYSSDENDQSLTPPVSALIPFDLTGTSFADNADEQFIVGRELFYSEKT